MAEYNVPQFVETEAKILGPFTIRDFFILLGAFLISALFFFLFQLWLAVILASIVLGGSVALLVVRINGRPLYTVAISALRFFWSPRLYLWQKPGIKAEEMLQERPIEKKAESAAELKEERKTPQQLTPEEIRKLAEKLDVK